MYWWEGDGRENVWMEITERSDIGGDLVAPQADRGGAASASYALVPHVRSGDIVVHYDSGAEAIVGASLVVGDPEPTSIYWVARGRSARLAGAQPEWLQGIRVPIDHYMEVSPALSLAELRSHESELLEVRRALQAQHGDKSPLYYPWVPYAGQAMRTFQSYLVKLPRDAVDTFPRLREATDRASCARAGTLSSPSKLELAEAALTDAASHRRGRRGQSYHLDQQIKVAVETYAMNRATEYYSERWIVEDVHGTESFDLRCTDGSKELHVEVKGTSTLGEEVLLTSNEVAHARSFPRVALFVVADITVERHANGSVSTNGGRVIVLEPWDIDGGTLRPVGYRYTLP